MSAKLGWGHININVSNLEASIEFYEKLGFEAFIPGIPYLNLTKQKPNALPSDAALALAIPADVHARACIMQLDNGFPKIDLTELSTAGKIGSKRPASTPCWLRILRATACWLRVDVRPPG